MKWIAFLLLLSLPAHAMGPWQDRCLEQEPCYVGDRSYHVKEPDGWDGKTPLPVMLHFHGWQRQGTLIVQHGRISGASRRRGVLLVAPNGLGRSWDFWDPETDDVPFARAVLDDIKKRYPVREDQIFVSGYSWGANMAWRFVCEDGADVAALMAVSGTLDQDEDCATAPREARQVYGLKDNVLDFPFGPNGEQDNVVRLWREAYGCGVSEDKGPWKQVDHLTMQRTEWNTCAAGRVSLDIHPGGHFIPHGWFARQLDELLGLEFSYP